MNRDPSSSSPTSGAARLSGGVCRFRAWPVSQVSQPMSTIVGLSTGGVMLGLSPLQRKTPWNTFPHQFGLVAPKNDGLPGRRRFVLQTWWGELRNVKRSQQPW